LSNDRKGGEGGKGEGEGKMKREIDFELKNLCGLKTSLEIYIFSAKSFSHNNKQLALVVCLNQTEILFHFHCFAI